MRQTAGVLVTITSTAPQASDLGFLLHKHPERVQSFDVPAGQAHVFYPQASEETCTAALLLEVDPVGLVRGKWVGASGGFSLGQYVNDRPYVASSLLAVALGRVFKTARAGRCDARPELVEQRLPLEIELPALPCDGGPDLARRMFAPLGWWVDARPVPLDPQVPRWGDSRYVRLKLTGQQRLADALNHVYVLLPVLDDAKHYWVGPDEVDKLVRTGQGWLPEHPEQELITRRYLAHQRRLVSDALSRLAELDDTEPERLDNAVHAEHGGHVSLARQRREAVLAVLREAGAARVVDLGCGEGALLRDLLAEPAFTDIAGVEVSDSALRLAERKLYLERRSERERARIRLLRSALTYTDERLAGFDAAVLMEVIEHVDPSRLPAVESTVFAHARPGTVLVTTPNAEYNPLFPDLPAGTYRHPDHRFEWDRTRFREWARRVAEANGYRVRFLPVGTDDAVAGPPTQMAVFQREVTDDR